MISSPHGYHNAHGTPLPAGPEAVGLVVRMQSWEVAKEFDLTGPQRGVRRALRDAETRCRTRVRRSRTTTDWEESEPKSPGGKVQKTLDDAQSGGDMTRRGYSVKDLEILKMRRLKELAHARYNALSGPNRGVGSTMASQMDRRRFASHTHNET